MASLRYRGVSVESRYDLKDEIDVIQQVVDVLSVPNRSIIKKIWCDSKASAVYSVEVEQDFPIESLLIEVDIAFRALGKGHNGILVSQGQQDHFIEPWWVVDDLECAE